MTALEVGDRHPVELPVTQLTVKAGQEPGTKGRWGRFSLILILTAITLIPIYVTLFLSIRPGAFSSTSAYFTLENFSNIFANTEVLTWLGNSLGVTIATVLVSVAVAAPAGYVLSRGRSRAVSGYSLLLFVVQSLPIITAVIPLFVLFARLGLADNLIGLVIVYVGSSMSVATWMMAAYFDSIPHTLEEAAWVDGCSVFGSFTKIVLRNSLPASSPPRSSRSWSPGTTTSSPWSSSSPATCSPCPSDCKASSSRTPPTGGR